MQQQQQQGIETPLYLWIGFNKNLLIGFLNNPVSPCRSLLLNVKMPQQNIKYCYHGP